MAMALQQQPYHHHGLLDLEEAFLADIGFGYDVSTPPSAALSQDQLVTSPEEGTSSGSGGTVASASGAGEDDGRGGGDRYRCAGEDVLGGGGDRDRGSGDDDRRLRRKLSNRESARRSRARKQRHLDEQHAAVAFLRASNRDLAERLRDARARSTLVELANARLRADGAALGRRLAAARRALALMQLYASAVPSPCGHLPR